MRVLHLELRDYFAAHAPVDPQEWYQPQMPPRPEPTYDHNHPNERRCCGEYCCLPANRDELNIYDAERRKQFCLQWPYAWADAMLAQREQE